VKKSSLSRAITLRGYVAEKFANTYLPGRIDKAKVTEEVSEAACENISSLSTCWRD
jgi:hypothetical protein